MRRRGIVISKSLSGAQSQVTEARDNDSSPADDTGLRGMRRRQLQHKHATVLQTVSSTSQMMINSRCRSAVRVCVVSCGSGLSIFVCVWLFCYSGLSRCVHVCVGMLPWVLWCCWLGGRKKLSGWVLALLSVWSEVQTWTWPSWCHFHSLSLASVKSILVLPSGTGSLG